MRKILSLAMAAAMTLSMASVAFAANFEVTEHYYAVDSDVVQNDGDTNPMIGYGKTAYFAILDAGNSVTDYDVVKNLRVKPQWTQNADLVDSVNVVKIKQSAGATAAYYVAVKTVSKDTTAKNEIAGKIAVSTKGDHTVDSANETIDPFITLGYTQANGTVATYVINEDEDETVTDVTATVSFAQASTYELTDSDKLVEFGNVELTADTDTVVWDSAAVDAEDLEEEAVADVVALETNKKFAATDEFEFVLYGGAGTFTVDTNGQGKILLSNTVKYNEGLETIYPDANYVYINGNGKSFNKTGTLFLAANEGDVLYQVKGDKLVKLDVEYDEYEEGFVLKTRTLGSYVIASAELDLSAAEVVAETPVVEAPAETVNPGTGVAL